MNLVICEDHQTYADALRRTLEVEPDIDIIATPASVEECLQVVEDSLPDVVLMDIQLPGLDGIEGARRIRASAPVTKVVMLTASDESDDLFRALKAGAVSYITKDRVSGDIADLLRSVVAGHCFIPAWAVERVAEVIEAQPAVPLTDQDQVMLDALGRAESQKATAQRLNLSERTVRRRVRALMEKLHLADRVQVALYAQSGWPLEEDR